MGDTNMANYMKIIGGVIGVVILIQVLASVLPNLFQQSFTNASVWGSLGSTILPTVWGLLLSAAVIVLLLKVGKSAVSGGKGGF